MNSEKKIEIFGKGLFGLKFKKNLVLDTGNSGTTARLLCSLLVDSNYKIKITGDQSLKKRDMKRIIKPLKKFGATFRSKNGKLPWHVSEDLKNFKKVTFYLAGKEVKVTKYQESPEIAKRR